METGVKDISTLEKVKEQADMLAMFTKRVKEQMVARQNGQTKNRPGKDPIESDELRAKGAPGVGDDPKQGRELLLPGIGPNAKGGEGASPFGRQVVVGGSTMGEYIRGIKEGAFTALNTDRFTFYTFFARVNEQVRSRWISNLRDFEQTVPGQEAAALSSRERVTELDVQLNKEGQFVRAVVMRSSGYKGLDEAASLAMKDAAPFPNAPAEMVEDDGLIHLHYGFIVHFSPDQLSVGR